VSLVQAAIGETLASHASERSPELTLMLFNLFNISDTFKIFAIALFTGTAAILIFRTHALPRWLGWTGILLSVLSIIGGLSFVLDSSVLYSLLYLDLPLLLLWVGGVSVSLLRQVEPAVA